MKRKVFSLLFALSFIMISNGNTINISSYLDDGTPSECVREARTTVMEEAALMNEDPNDDLDFWLPIYNQLYLNCLNN